MQVNFSVFAPEFNPRSSIERAGKGDGSGTAIQLAKIVWKHEKFSVVNIFDTKIITDRVSGQGILNNTLTEYVRLTPIS